jgi:hypothetical protein
MTRDLSTKFEPKTLQGQKSYKLKEILKEPMLLPTMKTTARIQEKNKIIKPKKKNERN